MQMRIPLLIGGAVIVAAVLFFALRPDDDAPSAAQTDTSTATAPAASSSTETSPISPEPPPLPTPEPPPPARVRIDVRDGQAVGGIRRVTVGEGRRVVLIVTADVTDHVHLHGYDIQRDVAPGKPARLAFRATLVGTAEVELEERRLPIASVTVQP